MSNSPSRDNNSLAGFVKFGAVVIVVSIGLWGCSRSPGTTATQDRLRSLESRCSQLEQDYRTVAQARDRARRDLAQAQEQLARHGDLQRELTDLRARFQSALTEQDGLRRLLAQRTSERDDLQQQMTQRMSEREVLLTRCDRLRKGLQSLLTQDDGPGSDSVPPMAAEGSE